MPPASLSAFVVIFTAAVAWGARRYRQSAGLDWEDRFAAALVPGAYVSVLAVYAAQISWVPFNDWNSCRLAPTMALRYGYALYYPPQDGPILGMLYGPFTAVAYLPALVARTPTTALLIAGGVTAVLVLGPLFVLNYCAGWKAASAGPGRHVGFLFAASAVLLHESTKYIATSVHADAPAVGFGLLACAALVGAGESIGTRRIALAATLAMLAAFSKQFEVALIAALAVCVWLRLGIRTAYRFIAWSVGGAAVLAGLFGWLWGFHAIVQSAVVLPMGHPRREWLHVANDFYGWLTGSTSIFLIVAAGVLVYVERSRRRTGSATPEGEKGGGESWETGPGTVQDAESIRWKEWTAHPVFALIVAAAFLVPASIAALARFGADANANHWQYFLIAAASLILSQGTTGSGLPLARALKRLSYLVSGATVLLVLPQLYHLGHFASLWDNPPQQAYEFARDHRGEVYFPWQPLSTLLAEGRAYHFEYGVYDRELVGAAPSERHFRAFLPPNLRYVLLHGSDEGVITQTRQYLPEFSRRTALPELPGWTAFERAEKSDQPSAEIADH